MYTDAAGIDRDINEPFEPIPSKMRRKVTCKVGLVTFAPRCPPSCCSPLRKQRTRYINLRFKSTEFSILKFAPRRCWDLTFLRAFEISVKIDVWTGWGGWGVFQICARVRAGGVGEGVLKQSCIGLFKTQTDPFPGTKHAKQTGPTKV